MKTQKYERSAFDTADGAYRNIRCAFIFEQIELTCSFWHYSNSLQLYESHTAAQLHEWGN